LKLTLEQVLDWEPGLIFILIDGAFNGETVTLPLNPPVLLIKAAICPELPRFLSQCVQSLTTPALSEHEFTRQPWSATPRKSSRE